MSVCIVLALGRDGAKQYQWRIYRSSLVKTSDLLSGFVDAMSICSFWNNDDLISLQIYASFDLDELESQSKFKTNDTDLNYSQLTWIVI